MLCHVALVRTDISEDDTASIIGVARLSKLGTSAVIGNRSTLLVTADVPSLPMLVTLMMEAIHSSEMSVLTRATWSNITEDCFLHSHCHENLKSYITNSIVYVESPI
jgi:hypothetical protein